MGQVSLVLTHKIYSPTLKTEAERQEGSGGLPNKVSSINDLLFLELTENLYGCEKARGRREAWLRWLQSPQLIQS